ncbi:hypothetical protein CYMTET_13679 [Cymbomonas tetramitiformis]|uniref:Uncharacterized protein n=1 Tax=Cymbomonas tetramitiformis TaxID=36881 RepID=A0AAE0GHX1_9CHLO|nr:hypothetical protein CYMTET_13679 [Cymbomonas tetramitiformis]
MFLFSPTRGASWAYPEIFGTIPAWVSVHSVPLSGRWEDAEQCGAGGRKLDRGRVQLQLWASARLPADQQETHTGTAVQGYYFDTRKGMCLSKQDVLLTLYHGDGVDQQPPQEGDAVRSLVCTYTTEVREVLRVPVANRPGVPHRRHVLWESVVQDDGRWRRCGPSLYLGVSDSPSCPHSPPRDVLGHVDAQEAAPAEVAVRCAVFV